MAVRGQLRQRSATGSDEAVPLRSTFTRDIRSSVTDLISCDITLVGPDVIYDIILVSLDPISSFRPDVILD